MGNVCCKGYSPKKTPNESKEAQEKHQNGETIKAEIEVPSHNQPATNQRQTSHLSCGSSGTLSDEEVSIFFTSPDDRYEIRQRRQSIDKGLADRAKSTDDLNANDIRLDLSGISNPAFASDGEEVLDPTWQSPVKDSSATPQAHRPDLVHIPDSFKLSKYVIDNTDQATGSNTDGSQLTSNEPEQIPRSMSSEEVIDLIDKLLLTNPSQSSMDPGDSFKFQLDSFSTSQEESNKRQKQTNMDRLKSTTRGKLTRMSHVNELLAEEVDITLRNEVLLETGHKIESLAKQDTAGFSKSSSSSSKSTPVTKEISQAAFSPSVSSNQSMGDDEEALWTGIEMTQQNLLARLEADEINKEEIVDVLDDISRHRQRMLSVRWAMPYKEEQDLPSELTQDRLSQKFAVERDYSEKLEDLNHEVASNLINAQKNKDLESLNAIMEDHKSRQSALHAQLVAEKERVDRRLAAKLKAKNDSKADDFEKDDNDETNMEKILGMSIDEIRRNPNKEDSIETESPTDFDGRLSRIDDHCGVIVHDSENEDHETDDLILTAYEELLDQSSDEEALSPDCLSDAKHQKDNEDVVTSSALRSTLKADVKHNLTRMSAADFQELLDVFRQQEKGPKQTKSKGGKEKEESLWNEVESRRQHGAKAANASVGHSFPSKSDAATEVGNSMMMHGNKDVAVQATEISNVNKDVQTIQKKFLQEAEGLDNDLIKKLNKRQEDMTQEELMKILNSHFDSVKDLRKRRKHESDKIQKKLEDKLRFKVRQFSSESTEDDGNDDVVRNSSVGSNAETEYKVHKKEMVKTDQIIEESEVKMKEELKKANDLSVDDVKQLLKDYRKQQKDLIQKRDIRRKLMNDKLLAVLEERKLQKNASKDSNTEHVEDYPNKHDRVSAKRKTILDQDVEEMDADFYKSLMDRYGKSSLTEAELDRLLEEHLNKVEVFKKKVIESLSKKRKERRAADKEQRKLRKVAKQQEEENAKHANELVQKQHEQASQMRQLRERERKRASLLLREKLAKKQLMVGEPFADLKISS